MLFTDDQTISEDQIKEKLESRQEGLERKELKANGKKIKVPTGSKKVEKHK